MAICAVDNPMGGERSLVLGATFLSFCDISGKAREFYHNETLFMWTEGFNVTVLADSEWELANDDRFPFQMLEVAWKHYLSTEAIPREDSATTTTNAK